IMMPNCTDWVLAFLAVTRMGGVAVGFSSLFQRREIAWALRHNDIDTLLVSAAYGHADYQARLEDAVPGLAQERAGEAFYLESAPYLRRIVVWGEALRPWACKGPDHLLAAARATPRVSEALLREIEATVTPADDMVVICTSGTTAEPKAVVHAHGGAIRNVWNFSPWTYLEPGERFYNGLAYFWVGGFLRGVFPALFRGATLVHARSLSGEDLLDAFVRHRVTNVYFGGAQRHALLAAAARQGVDLSFITYGLTPMRDRRAGEEIPPERRIGGSLGMTETFGTHSSDPDDLPAPEGKAANWGRPMPDVERRIVDLETGEVLGPGETGELQLRGRNMMRGYWKRERDQAFTADGWFRTGDRCMIDEHDFLFFYGRANDMIKTAGANVSPAEVEAVLVGLPEVREAIVLGVPDPARGEAVAAVVVPEDGFTIDPDALRRKVRAELSAYKAPQIIVAMAFEDVPRTDAAGKPKRAELRALLMAARQPAG
ncbi:MAG: long-chain fatty acid--CoA ligase, partial [Phenylobacterium sp.]|nr:long-chain fatty acid--CoA ligase [Phenylobacterium sp.]